MSSLNHGVISQQVLVTGGGGFLGRALVEQLLQRTACRVRVLALPHESIPPRWLDLVDVVRGNITRLDDVARAAQGCGHIFHLAALVGDAGSYAEHERITVGGTAHVFDVAARGDATVVLTTSICAYGDALQRGPCPEDTPLGRPQGPYGRAKQGQEALAWRFRDQGGRVCVVRPANIIGPGSGPWLLDAAKALRQGLPALVAGGHGNAALTAVDNVADFLLLTASTPESWGQAYNFHDGLDVSWRQYFLDLAALMAAPKPRTCPRWLAYLAAQLTEPLCRRLWPNTRPPVTREALNLVAWNNQFPIDKALALGWTPRISHAQVMAQIGQDVLARGL